MKTLFNVRSAPWDTGIQIDIAVRDEHGQLSAMKDITFEAIAPGSVLTGEPLLRLRESEAQELVDALWAAGVRPTAGKGSAGQLAAVERHLEDMRQMVQSIYGAPKGPAQETSNLKPWEIVAIK